MAELLFGWHLYLGTGLAFVGGALSGAVGIGGGGIYVPVLILIIGYTAKEAIPLSKVTVAGVAISSFIVNVLRRHPQAPWRALIDYDVAMVMTPTTLLGTTVGVLVYVILPEWLILILLILVLGLVDYRTFVSARKLWQKEKLAAALEKERLGITSVNPTMNDGVGMPTGHSHSLSHSQAIAVNHNTHRDSTAQAHADGLAHSLRDLSINCGGGGGGHHQHDDHGDDDGQVEAGFPKEKQPLLLSSDETSGPAAKAVLVDMVAPTKPDTCLPLWAYDAIKVFYLAIVWCIMFALVFLRGGGEADTSYVGIKKCSTYFWVLWSVMFPIMIGFMVLSCVVASLIYAYRKRHGWPFLEGDVQWRLKSLLMIPIAGTVGGTAAGFLGIGSGMVNGPVMLEIGMKPEVATATSSFIIVFTALSTVSQYFVIGALHWQAALWFFVLGVLAAVFGQYGVQWVVKRTNKSSIISFLLAFVIAGSGVAMIVTGALQIVDEGITGFADMCELSDKPHPSPSPAINATLALLSSSSSSW